MIPDAGNAVRDCNTRQIPAEREGMITNFFELIRKGDSLETDAFTEGTLPDASNAIAKPDRLQVCTAEE